MNKHLPFNIQRSTPNQPAVARRRCLGHWMLDVGCWMYLFLLLFLGGGSTTGILAGEPSTPLSPAAAANAPKRAFTEADVLALLTSTLQRGYVQDQGQLELILKEPWTALAVPGGPLSLKILELPTVGVTPSFIVRFELCTASESLGTWQTAVEAHVWRDVWVAHSNLRRGDLVGDADVVRKRCDVLNIHEALANFAPGDATLELAEPVPAGVPLLARMLKPKTVLFRGQMATAFIQDGALSITVRVEVLDDGATGQMVHVRNLASQRNLLGRVLDDQTVLLTL